VGDGENSEWERARKEGRKHKPRAHRVGKREKESHIYWRQEGENPFGGVVGEDKGAGQPKSDLIRGRLFTNGLDGNLRSAKMGWWKSLNTVNGRGMECG
jgi:hypothetical protein